MIRTRKIPFIQSSASLPVVLSTLTVMAVGVALPFISIGAKVGLVPLPLHYFTWLAATLLCYCILTQIIKQWYIRRFTRWL